MEKTETATEFKPKKGFTLGLVAAAKGKKNEDGTETVTIELTGIMPYVRFATMLCMETIKTVGELFGDEADITSGSGNQALIDSAKKHMSEQMSRLPKDLSDAQKLQWSDEPKAA